MTPMLQMIVRDAMLPEAKRQLTAGLPGLVFAKFVAFDLSAVADLVVDLASKIEASPAVDPGVAFLPFPMTWIEFDNGVVGPNRRFAWGLQDAGSGRAVVWVAGHSRSGGVSLRAIPQVLELRSSARFGPPRTNHFGLGGASDWSRIMPDVPSDQAPAVLAANLYACLALINSPRAIARREHAPHKGVQREIKRHSDRCELRPWTQILLDVPAERGGEDDGDPSVPSGPRLTGEKARHRCRTYGQLRGGKVVFVKTHWRGNPELGLVRATYRLKSPKTQETKDGEG